MPAAAANPFDEAHSSRFAFFDVKDFVKATKPHIKNPGALARVIWRSGVEDEAIERWNAEQEERRQLQERLKESETEIASDFSMDARIDDLITNNWIAQLENEREEIESRGGPQLDWERRVIAYFKNRAASDSAKVEQFIEQSSGAVNGNGHLRVRLFDAT